jgi:hypothetical protein
LWRRPRLKLSCGAKERRGRRRRKQTKYFDVFIIGKYSYIAASETKSLELIHF